MGFVGDEKSRKAAAIVTEALFFFAIVSALAQVVMGFVGDEKSRKAAAIVTASLCILSFLGFFIGSNLGWNAGIVGLLTGASIGSFYATNDMLIMMVGESAPTNLRSSTIAAQFVANAIGAIASYGVGVPLLAALGNRFAGYIVLCMAVPGLVFALVTLCLKTKDTKGINMNTVAGCEWD